ncbi:hypothetical protein HPB48_021268 [Haemaphysalis longicornis]|uniref:Elongation of very long chain fatty acids protein n=1 Tax=Haemaphysalis longicornis TaxID=44386 RepID=A0A9J6GEL0_HAELO|nr:hypothetical protein HPB48_021268 [Haemaphysalis longicornis]
MEGPEEPPRPPFLARRDMRIAHWPLVGDFRLVLAVVTAYVYAVKIAGPRFMERRRPYDGIKPLIVIYNVTMVVANVYLTCGILRAYLGDLHYSVVCQGIDYDGCDESTMGLMAVLWWFYVSRFADLLDTVFFVLRKKDSHVSVLHVAHHTIVLLSACYGLTFGIDGQGAFSIMINCFVHVVMYSYYLLSLMGPTVQKHLWWKRYLTQFQLVQFVVQFVHMMIPMFMECRYPLSHCWVVILQCVFYFGMFIRFYLKAYRPKQIGVTKAK